MRRSTQGIAAKSRTELAKAIRKRKGEIEEAIAARSRAIADPSEVQDPTYVLGLKDAIATAIDYGIEAIESSERNPPEIPLQLLTQARLAARAKVPLDTVLRRYFAGHTLLGDFVLEEAERCGIGAGELKRRMRAQGAFVERLIGAVAQEYEREVARRPRSLEERKSELVRGLLAGGAGGSEDLDYDLELTHIGIIIEGNGGEVLVRDLGALLEMYFLVVQIEPDVVWAWIGTQRAQEVEKVISTLTSRPSVDLTIACGEPANGLSGWRLTHRQAHAALPVAVADSQRFAHYADVSLLAATLANDLLSASLRRQFLFPLCNERDGGEAARQTLDTYFATGQHVSATAASLGVTRQTVNSRLRNVEERIGRSLISCSAEFTVALRLERLI